MIVTAIRVKHVSGCLNKIFKLIFEIIIHETISCIYRIVSSV